SMTKKYVDRGELKTAGTRFEEGEVKARSNRRLIDVDAGTIEALRVHRACQENEKQSLGNAYQDNGVVFATVDGRHMSPWYVTARFRQLIKTLPVRSITVHGLRHTGPTLALSRGEPMKTVQQRTGHASARTLLDHYAHAIPSGGAELA